VRTVAVTVDNLAEAADLGRGRIAAPLPAGANPALEVGFPALLALLDRVGLRVTWFVEGWNGEAHPEAVAEIVRRGHHVGAHGWQHEEWAALAPADEAALLDRSLDALAAVVGTPPTTFRAPGGRRTPRTLALLAERGVGFDASLAPDGSTCSAPQRTTEGPTWLGFDWSLVDATHWLWSAHSAADGAARLRAALDAAPSGPDDVAVLIVHAHITGIDPARVAAIEGLLSDLRTDPEVRLAALPAGDVS
jgi:peptidoglycan/xylan/chitin deacetylase (PgdA/CDA1 family)